MYTFFSEAIYKLGAKYRNPSVFRIYEELKNTEFKTLDELRELQFHKLKELLIFAQKHSPFYNKHFAEANFDPGKMESFDELADVPPLSKPLLVTNNKQVHTSFKFRKAKTAITSGTSGLTLKFLRSEEWDSTNRASIMRCYDWYDVKPWEKNGYLWGFNIEGFDKYKVRILDWMQNRFRIFKYDKKSISEFSKNLSKSTYMGGYSSMIYQVAKSVNEMDVRTDNIKMVKGTSEMILEAYQPEVIKAFGSKMISEYGSAESGLIAFECPDGGLHINMETVYVETNNEGEILVTNLVSHSFPIIRYKLGDIVKLSEKSCSCGRSHPLIEEIAGRKGKNIVGKSSSYPGFTFYYVFKNISLSSGISLNYKAEQFSPGKIVLKIEGERSEHAENILILELEKYFKDDIEFQLVYVDIFDNKDKKRQSFESYL